MRALRDRFFPIALIALAVLSIYWPVRHGDWLWDDRSEVTENQALRDAAGLRTIWLTTRSLDYFPLKSTVEWLEWHAWGERTFGYHLVNLGLHALSGVLFALLLGRLARAAADKPGTDSEGETPWWAWLGGLLFVAHPLAVESVAWIAELKNTLSLPPLLLAALAYLDYDEKGRSRDRWRALAWFAVAMLCKSSVVILPAGLLLYGWWRRGRVGRRDLRATAGLFAVALALGLTTVWFQHHRAMAGRDLGLGGGADRFVQAGRALLFYGAKSLWPAGLDPIYAFARPPFALWRCWPWAALAGLAMAFWRRREGLGRHALFALGWFVLALAPVLGFIPMAYLRLSWVADHLAYLALLAPAGLAAAAAGALQPRFGRALPLAVAAVLSLALATASRRYAANFSDEQRLWSTVLRRNPDAWAAWNNLGEVRMTQERTEDAAALFRQALRLKPDYVEAHDNLGSALADEGRLGEATAECEAALRLDPRYASAHNHLGRILQREGRLPQAIAEYRRALRCDSDFAAAYDSLGLAFFQAGRPEVAVAEYQAALRLNPDSYNTRNSLGVALARLGRFGPAEEQYAAALRLKPDDADIAYNWGDLLYAESRWAEAAERYAEAARLRPDEAAAHNGLGSALFAQGKIAAAGEEFAQAVRLEPSSAEAHNNLGSVLEAEGRRAAAAGEYAAALRADPQYRPAQDNLARLRGAAAAGGQKSH